MPINTQPETIGTLNAAGGGGLSAPLTSTNSGGAVNLSTTPATIASVSIPAPSSGTDTYLVLMQAGEDMVTVNSADAIHSVYFLDDGAPIMASGATGAYLPAQAVPVADGMAGGSVFGWYKYDATGAVTLAFKGQLSGGNPTTGNWKIETGLGKLFAIKLYNTP